MTTRTEDILNECAASNANFSVYGNAQILARRPRPDRVVANEYRSGYIEASSRVVCELELGEGHVPAGAVGI
jgi:hypothetical protein